MFANPATFPGPDYLARMAGKLGLAAFSVFVVIGALTQLGDPVRASAGALLALLGAIPLLLVRTRLTLGYAAAATMGVALLGNANPRDIGWFAVVVLAAWCVLSGGIATGTFYWGASVLVFGAEWLWAFRDPGWGPWTAGVTVTVLATTLIRHEFILLEQLRATQAGLAERSRTEERNRIARELHDVIAHSLTVSLLHVSSARLAIEHDPADAARALAEAERLARQSLAEVRATVGLLRPQSTEGIAPPVPSLDRVPGLVEQLRDVGADICLDITGDVGAVPATAGSTIYRIMQEALTNATKHASGCAVRVHIVVGDAASRHMSTARVHPVTDRAWAWRAWKNGPEPSTAAARLAQAGAVGSSTLPCRSNPTGLWTSRDPCAARRRPGSRARRLARDIA